MVQTISYNAMISASVLSSLRFYIKQLRADLPYVPAAEKRVLTNYWNCRCIYHTCILYCITINFSATRDLRSLIGTRQKVWQYRRWSRQKCVKLMETMYGIHKDMFKRQPKSQLSNTCMSTKWYILFYYRLLDVSWYFVGSIYYYIQWWCVPLPMRPRQWHYTIKPINPRLYLGTTVFCLLQ